MKTEALCQLDQEKEPLNVGIFLQNVLLEYWNYLFKCMDSNIRPPYVISTEKRHSKICLPYRNS